VATRYETGIDEHAPKMAEGRAAVNASRRPAPNRGDEV
jgi:hypothetical protein